MADVQIIEFDEKKDLLFIISPHTEEKDKKINTDALEASLKFDGLKVFFLVQDETLVVVKLK